MSDKQIAGLEADLHGALRQIEELETRLETLLYELEHQLEFYFPHTKR